MEYNCLICNSPVDNYNPVMCCSGHECGCMGQPTEPCICSRKCSDALFTCIGTFEDRRITAGIELHIEEATTIKPSCSMVLDDIDIDYIGG